MRKQKRCFERSSRSTLATDARCLACARAFWLRVRSWPPTLREENLKSPGKMQTQLYASKICEKNITRATFGDIEGAREVSCEPAIRSGASSIKPRPVSFRSAMNQTECDCPRADLEL